MSTKPARVPGHLLVDRVYQAGVSEVSRVVLSVGGGLGGAVLVVVWIGGLEDRVPLGTRKPARYPCVGCDHLFGAPRADQVLARCLDEDGTGGHGDR